MPARLATASKIELEKVPSASGEPMFWRRRQLRVGRLVFVD